MLSVDIKKDFGSFKYSYNCSFDSLISVIRGPSGSGKSTLFKSIAGLIKPDTGKIVLDDKVVFDSRLHINLKPQERHIGYCFQNFALFPHLSVRDNILIGLHNIKDKDEKKRIFDETVEMLSLGSILNQKPYTISGGQAQRTALARMIVNKPKIFLFDEVFSSLDEELSIEVQHYIKDLIQRLSIQSVFITHTRSEADFLSQSHYTINNGLIYTNFI